MTRRDVHELSGLIDGLLSELHATTNPRVTARVEELIRAIVELYGAGLERVASVVGASPNGEKLLRTLAEDELVSGLLLLHDLHPDDLETRVQQALDQARPYLGSHAGGVDYLGIDDAGTVLLRLRGSCDGCPGSTATVKLTLEQAVLDAAPEATAVEVEGMVAEGPKLLQIEPFQPHTSPGSDQPDAGDTWHPIRLDIDAGRLGRTEAGGTDLLIANLGGTFYAYRNTCSACAARLHDARLDGDVLTCTGCDTAYDIRLAGRGLTPGAAPLRPFPLLPDGTGWKVAIRGGLAA